MQIMDYLPLRSPVPFPAVKSPPWHMNFGMTRWNLEPLYPKPASPVHSCLKFSAQPKEHPTFKVTM